MTVTARGVAVGLLILWVIAAGGCHDAPPPHAATASNRGPVKPRPGLSTGTSESSNSADIKFTEVARQWGVRCDYFGSPSPERYMVEQNGGGVALFDYDRDGRIDYFFTNGSHFDRPSADATHRLYRSVDQHRTADVTVSAGLNVAGFGMGCAVGDFDNDGFDDVFAAGYGEDWFWQNNGDGTFTRLEFDPLREERLWGTSAAFADFDGDGLLDLYVVDYVDYTADDPPCFTQHQPPIRISCGPRGRIGQGDRLYHNRGDGRFADVSGPSGIGAFQGKGLGIAVADFDRDSRLDMYVANDTTRNLLFLNRDDMRFEEIGILYGVAVADNGRPTSGMGVGCADFDSDGWFDLLITNFDGEPYDLYRNRHGAGFEAVNAQVGLDTLSRPMLGFGAQFADFNLDQRMDLFLANGHVWYLRSAAATYEYKMHPQLLSYTRDAAFRDVSLSAGEYFQEKWLGRAAAIGDVDDDGDTDLVVTHLEAPAAILRNDSATRGSGVRLRVIGTSSARSARGTTIEYVVGEHTRVTRVPAGDGFQSSSDARPVLNMGDAGRISRLTIYWPHRPAESWTNLIPRNGELQCLEGTGQIPTAVPDSAARQ